MSIFAEISAICDRVDEDHAPSRRNFMYTMIAYHVACAKAVEEINVTDPARAQHHWQAAVDGVLALRRLEFVGEPAAPDHDVVEVAPPAESKRKRVERAAPPAAPPAKKKVPINLLEKGGEIAALPVFAEYDVEGIEGCRFVTDRRTRTGKRAGDVCNEPLYKDCPKQISCVLHKQHLKYDGKTWGEKRAERARATEFADDAALMDGSNSGDDELM